MICLAENIGGKGGIAGGAGSEGQASVDKGGIGANSYGYPTIETVTGVTKTFEIQLTKDYTGAIPADLSDVSKVVFEMRPTMNSYDKKVMKECTFTPDGVVTLELGPAEVNYNNGVWFAEFKAYKETVIPPTTVIGYDPIESYPKDSDPQGTLTYQQISATDDQEHTGILHYTVIEPVDQDAQEHKQQAPVIKSILVHDYRTYVNIRKGMDGSCDSDPNTITVMDVRMAIMDVSPEANVLLDDLEFSDVQILAAVERCIDEWEETPPTLGTHFNGRTFPFREHLIKGVVGYLMQQIAYKYTRNRMQYNAAGLTLDTNDKGPQYIALAQAARDEWLNFVNHKKTEMNMAECFGTVDIPCFGGGGWWW